MTNKVSIDKLTEGVVISKQLENKFGQVLLPANTTLNKNHISMLKLWGIKEVELHDLEASISHKTNFNYKTISKDELLKSIDWVITNNYEDEITDLLTMILNQKFDRTL
ncbi:hypothetical protein MASR1M45_20030 [Candidatus Kapaibacterium sp.]